MAIRDILIYPDPRLRRIATPVLEFDDQIQQYVDDMAETMYDAPGLGLAAIQVAIPKSIIVIDVSERRNELQVLINPKILESQGEQEIEEGCLSFPGYFTVVKRSQWIRFQAQDRYGNSYEREAEDLFAVCIQHEIDHLSGKLFMDYLSRLKKDRVKRHFVKAAKARRRQQLANI